VNDLERELRDTLRSSYFDDPVDTRALLVGVRSRQRPGRAAFLPPLASAMTVAATVLAVLMVLSLASGKAPRTTHPPQMSGTVPVTGARTMPAIGDGQGTRTYPLTPTWLPFGLSTTSSYLEGGDVNLWISRSPSDNSGPQIEITIADASALTSIDPWNHLISTATTVNGLPATLALPTIFQQGGHTIDRTGYRYLLFQRSRGQWVLIGAQQAAHRPADATTLKQIALGLVAAPLHVFAPTPQLQPQISTPAPTS
jgi:hypothetical protein